MRCYKCGSALSDSDFCNSCGANVAVYKKIIKLSNSYYNMGLEKAKIRDLSGAADILRRSVRMYKKNTQARNLLGLVYYEMGEIVEALGQWVISKNIQPEKNVADDYLKDAQSNPAKLEAMNMTIRKYNTSLSYVLDGSDDMAIIQLKKVISLNPKYVKAYQLLALLYMKKEEYGRAKKLLKKSLAIDHNNTLSMKYLDEIKKATEADGEKPVEEVETKALSGNDVIIPATGYKDVNYGVMQFITIVVGIIIGAAMVYFLISPAKENRSLTESKQTINEQAEQLTKLQTSLEEMQNTISTLTDERDRLQSIVDAQNTSIENGAPTTSYETLIEAARLYMEDKKTECAIMLLGINNLSDQDERFNQLYDSLSESTFQDAFNEKRLEGIAFENTNEYDKAIESFMVCAQINPQDVEILYHLGQDTVRNNDNALNDAARAYFDKILELEPDSQYASYVTQYYYN